jgi:hypothetical protein
MSFFESNLFFNHFGLSLSPSIKLLDKKFEHGLSRIHFSPSATVMREIADVGYQPI